MRLPRHHLAKALSLGQPIDTRRHRPQQRRRQHRRRRVHGLACQHHVRLQTQRVRTPSLAECVTVDEPGTTKGPTGYFRMLTARATTSTATMSEIASSAIIKSLAHGRTAETSVGLKAIAVLNERWR